MNAFFKLARKRVAVTGATGFVGGQLVDLLLQQNCHVVALGSSEGRSLKSKPVEYVRCDLVTDFETVKNAVKDCEIVFHLAARTRAVRSPSLLKTNPAMTETVLKACVASAKHPTVILVSSLAAVGPSNGSELLREDQENHPISLYGKSKSRCEDLALSFADRLSISIVRPPIVLGPGDDNGLSLFNSIDRWRRHFVPGLKTQHYSIIHVEDLAVALIGVAENGKRLSSNKPSQGIYFASSDEVVTYAELGQLIADATGVERYLTRHIPGFIIRIVGMVNEVIARVTSRSQYLNHDKFRDVLGGSWACSNQKIKAEVGFKSAKPLRERLKETAVWYRENGWLKPRELRPSVPTHEIAMIGARNSMNDRNSSTMSRDETITPSMASRPCNSR